MSIYQPIPTQASPGLDLIVFQSATYIYLKSIFALEQPPQDDFNDIFYECPSHFPTKTLSQVYHKCKSILDTQEGFLFHMDCEEWDTVSRPIWKSCCATPGMFLLLDLMKSLLEDDNYRDPRVVCVRKYTDAAGISRKVSWASGLGKEINAGRELASEPQVSVVIDLGGDGTMKFLDVSTTNELRLRENTGHVRWVSEIESFLRYHNKKPVEVVLAFTGKLRKGHSHRHTYAESAINHIRKSIPGLEVIELSVENERTWENSSAREAVSLLFQDQEKKINRLVNIASGSSTTQIGSYSSGKYAGITYNVGIHLKPPTPTPEQIRYINEIGTWSVGEWVRERTDIFKRVVRCMSNPLLVRREACTTDPPSPPQVEF